MIAGVDFIKVGRTAQIVEIALLKLGAWRKGCSTPLKASQKLGVGRKKVYEIDPRSERVLSALSRSGSACVIN